jgi:hypothetical protein
MAYRPIQSPNWSTQTAIALRASAQETGEFQKECSMNFRHFSQTALGAAGAVLALAASLLACAGAADSWKEEVLLHDGQKIIVERSVERGGRHEVGQQGSYVNQTLRFNMPGDGQAVKWLDELSPDIGNSSFLPMLLDIFKGVPYLVAYPMGCLSYNKWGRPNPPYVVFKYDSKSWQRVALEALPSEIRTPNLIFSDPDNEMKRQGKSFASAETIRQVVGRYMQPEFKTIVREKLSEAKLLADCEVRVSYKGRWILPNDPIARQFIDSQEKK